MTNTPQSVQHPWTSDQPDTETSYLTIHNPLAGFKPAISTRKWQQTHALDYTTT